MRSSTTEQCRGPAPRAKTQVKQPNPRRCSYIILAKKRTRPPRAALRPCSPLCRSRTLLPDTNSIKFNAFFYAAKVFVACTMSVTNYVKLASSKPVAKPTLSSPSTPSACVWAGNANHVHGEPPGSCPTCSCTLITIGGQQPTSRRPTQPLFRPRIADFCLHALPGGV